MLRSKSSATFHGVGSLLWPCIERIQWPANTNICAGSRSACMRKITACSTPTVSTICRNSVSPRLRSPVSSSSWLLVQALAIH